MIPGEELQEIEMSGPKIPAIQGILAIRGVSGVITSLRYNKSLDSYRVEVANLSKQVSYHLIAVSDVNEVKRPGAGFQTSQRS